MLQESDRFLLLPEAREEKNPLSLQREIPEAIGLLAANAETGAQKIKGPGIAERGGAPPGIEGKRCIQ